MRLQRVRTTCLNILTQKNTDFQAFGRLLVLRRQILAMAAPRRVKLEQHNRLIGNEFVERIGCKRDDVFRRRFIVGIRLLLDPTDDRCKSSIAVAALRAARHQQSASRPPS